MAIKLFHQVERKWPEPNQSWLLIAAFDNRKDALDYIDEQSAAYPEAGYRITYVYCEPCDGCKRAIKSKGSHQVGGVNGVKSCNSCFYEFVKWRHNKRRMG